MVSSRGTLRGSQGSPRCLGAVSGFLLKLIRESAGLTQVQLAEKLGVTRGRDDDGAGIVGRPVRLIRLCAHL